MQIQEAKQHGISMIEKEVLNTMHSLPLDKQQTILEFSLFLKSTVLGTLQKNEPVKRQAGLGKGKAWISDDFDEPLPDSFWLGED